MRFIINTYIIFIVTINFIGCAIPAASDWANEWIGTNINIKKSTYNNKSGSPYVQWWRDNKINKDYYLPNGNLIHVHPIRKDCLIHWEVDKNTNKIIGYKFEGDRCY